LRFGYVISIRVSIAFIVSENICEAMIKTWTMTGLPEAIVIDNAKYFRGNLVRELTKRFGCAPRFSTPYHPEGHAMAERLVGTVQRMILKIDAFLSKAFRFGYTMQQTNLSNILADADTVLFNSAHNVRHCLHTVCFPLRRECKGC
jgi:transposase InsO family protein